MDWLYSFAKAIGETVWNITAAPEHSISKQSRPSVQQKESPISSGSTIENDIKIRNRRIDILQGEIADLLTKYEACLKTLACPTAVPSQISTARTYAVQLKVRIDQKQTMVRDLSSQVIVLEKTLTQLESAASTKSMQKSVVNARGALGDNDDNDDLLDRFQEAADDLQSYEDTSRDVRMSMAGGNVDEINQSIDADLAAMSVHTQRKAPPPTTLPVSAPSILEDDDSENMISWPSVPGTGPSIRVMSPRDTAELLKKAT